MTYKSLDLNQIDIWIDYLNKLPIEQQDIYFTPEYYQLYENYGDGKAMCFVYQEDDNIALYSFLKNSINELGYKLDAEYYDIQGAYGYNGVVANCSIKGFRANFFSAFQEYCINENIVAEFTRFHPLLKNYKFSMDYMEVIHDRKTIFLDLTKDKDEIWKKSYSSNNRNMIRKALKNNVEIIESKNREDYKMFYLIYIETMNNVNSDAYLYFNEKYFLDFLDHIPANHKLILARYNDEIIGGMILMIHKDYAHYHLSSRKVDFGKLALNNLFLDYAINEAKKEGCQLFHFGGGNSSDEKDTLLKFKSNFSKDKAAFYIGKKVHNPKVYNEVIETWEETNESKKKKLKSVLLKYRM